MTDDPADYAFPWSAHVYGQMFLCISVKASQINTIGLQFIYNEVEIYKFQMSKNLE